MVGRFIISLSIGVLLGVIPLGVDQSRGNTTISESQVKAAYLYHFTKFIDWPSNSFSSSLEKFTVCVIEGEEIRQAIHKTLKGKKVKHRELEIQTQTRDQDHSSCHLIYVGSEQTEWFAGWVKNMKKTNILTIGESELFISQGGMVQFYFENNKVRFAMNPNAIQEGHLKASSKLLRLAKIVKP